MPSSVAPPLNCPSLTALGSGDRPRFLQLLSKQRQWLDLASSIIFTFLQIIRLSSYLKTSLIVSQLPAISTTRVATSHSKQIWRTEISRMGLEKVKHVVLVLSGKGGVGKSSVTTQLALSLSLAGHSVGILDVDLTGPSIPRMLSIEASKVTQVPGGWAPVVVHEANPSEGLGSLHAMSLGFLLPKRGDAVVWRGPKKTAMIRQFLKDVLWEETDYLLIDTPPGTSDEHISLAETLQRDARPGQVAGAVVVTTPQAVSTADVRKELNFCKKTGIRVLGVVENMSGYVCPHCSECTDIFGSGGGKAMAEEFQVPFLGSVPMDAQFITLIEEGKRPTYPVGTKINGNDISTSDNHGSADGQVQREGNLVDKYKDCSLFHIFGNITESVREGVSDGEQR